MTFANPWGLLGLLALPVIVVIHLYQRRYPPLLISSAHLWGVEAELRDAGRRRDRLPITATLLLELLAALLLSLVFSQPRFGEQQSAVHVVAVLDDSASMQAVPPGEPSFRDRALATLRQRITDPEDRQTSTWLWMALIAGAVAVSALVAAGLLRDTGAVLGTAMGLVALTAVFGWLGLSGFGGSGEPRVTVLRTGRRPVMLAGPAIAWEQAEPSLAQWKPSAPAHDFQPAWDLASQLAGEEGRMLFLTDRVPGTEVAAPRSMEVVSVGEPLENVAISTARWVFDSQQARGRLFLRVTNHGRKSADVLIQGRAGEELIFSENRSIEAGRSLPLETDLRGGLGQIKVTLRAPQDALPLDNSVTLIEPTARQLNVALALPEDHSAREPIERVLRQMPDLQFTDAEEAELVITTPEPLPASRSDLWWLGIGPLDLSEEARESAITPSNVHPYLLEKRDPLMDGVILGGVVWGGVQPVELQVTPLISAGEYPLLARLPGTRTTAYLMNIDMARSNLAESPDWPILLQNLIALRRDALPGLRRWNYRVAEPVRFQWESPQNVPGDAAGSPAADDLQLIHNGRTRPLPRAEVIELPPLEETGVYEIRDGRQSVGSLAVNFFDADESHLTDRLGGERLPPESDQPTLLTIDASQSRAVMLGLGLIVILVLSDWKVLR